TPPRYAAFIPSARHQLSRIARCAAAQQILNNVSEIKLNLGSGPVKGRDGWLTVDQYEGVDIQWDLNSALPFPDGSVSQIYSSHVLEHFYYRDLTRLLT